MNPRPPADTTILYLVRHGATDANESRPYILQGSGIDMPLSETGRKQAAAVGRFFRDYPLAGVYSSHLQRAVETAQAVAGHHELEVRTHEALAECNVGRWEGMDWDSIMAQHPEEYRAFMENPAENPYLGGESYGDVLQRSRPVLEELLECHLGESIAVVAHNVVNRVYLAHVMGMELSRAKDIRQINTGVNVIRYRQGECELMTLNSFFHLDDGLMG